MILRRCSFVLMTAVLAVTVYFISPVFAAEETNISISPLTFDLAANPGDTVTNEILVRNTGSEAVIISVEAQDFVATGEEGEVSLTDKSTYSLASWIEMDGNGYELGPGKQRAVKFVIRVPHNAEPGGHYASVYAHLSPTTDAAESGSYIGQKIGSLVLLRVAGDMSEGAKFESYETSQKYYEDGLVEFNIRIKNEGSVHIKPKGIIAIIDMFGKKVADVTVEQKNVLPQATRKMNATWSETPAFGKFTATVLAYYGEENKQITAVTSFWIIPWKTFAVWGGGIILLGVILWFGRGRIRAAGKALLAKN